MLFIKKILILKLMETDKDNSLLTNEVVKRHFLMLIFNLYFRRIEY